MPCEVLNLDQLLTDPLIRMVMQSDHVAEDEVRTVMGRASRASARRRRDQTRTDAEPRIWPSFGAWDSRCERPSASYAAL